MNFFFFQKKNLISKHKLNKKILNRALFASEFENKHHMIRLPLSFITNFFFINFRYP